MEVCIVGYFKLILSKMVFLGNFFIIKENIYIWEVRYKRFINGVFLFEKYV